MTRHPRPLRGTLSPMKNTKKEIEKILNGLSPQLEAHDCYMEVSAVKGNKVFISCGGEGAVCENKCIDEVIKEKIPDIEIVYV